MTLEESGIFVFDRMLRIESKIAAYSLSVAALSISVYCIS